MPRKRSWTDDELKEAVAASSTYKEVQQRLGLKPGSSHVAIRVRIAELGIDAEHLDMAVRREKARQARDRRAGAPPRKSMRQQKDGGHRWNPEELRTAVSESRSYAQVLRRLGYQPGGSTYIQLKQQIADLEIDTSHMTGKAWARGRKRPEVSARMNRPLEEILVKDSDYLNTHHLKRRLLAEGALESRCYDCGITTWNGRPAPLQLDHINGDRRDNRLENLRLLCPNCHAQTDTWCGKNVGAYDA